MSSTRAIVVREFNYLVPKNTGRGDCSKLSGEEFAALREFILGNRGSEDNPLELMRLCALPGIGEAIQLSNYVGVVELSDGLQIEILPKIDASGGKELDERDIFLAMLAELGTGTSFKSSGNANVATGRLPLFEVFVAMFLEECSALVRAGLRSAYREVRSQEAYIRGRIDFTRQVREASVHAELMHVIHDEFVLDRAENRLIKSTLMLLRRKSTATDNVRRITQLLASFDDVQQAHDIDAEFSRCVVDRGTKGYATVLEWCRVFLKGESFTMFHGSNVATAILFPMERIFEDYVGRVLRRRALGQIVRVDLQAATQWLFEDRQVSLRPDILCKRHDGRNVVMDTKWKRIQKPKDVSVADMYQMYAYGQRYRSHREGLQHIVLLYPWHKGVGAGLLRSGRRVSRDGVQVDMFFVDLSDMARSMNDLIGVVTAF